MHPILLKVGIFNIYSYGVLVALGFGMATFLAYRRAPAFGLDAGKVIDMAIIVLITGIAGARALYVALNFSHYAASPLEIFDLSKGGLIWYGGLVLGVISLAVFVKRSGMDFWDVGDLMVPYTALAQAAGRIGCFLNGCCFGVEATPDYVFGVVFPGDDIIRHPTQVYSSLGMILIYCILRIWQERRHFKGEIFLAYVLLYSASRFLMEFLRGDNARLFLDLTMSQWISAAAFIVSLCIFIMRYRTWKIRHSTLK